MSEELAPVFDRARPGSFAAQIPALTLLQVTVFSIAVYNIGIPKWGACVVGLLLFFGEELIAEENWDLSKFCFVALLALLAVILPFYVMIQFARDDRIPSMISGQFTIAERRGWGESQLLRLIDDHGGGWTASARDELESAREGERYSLTAAVVSLPDSMKRDSFVPARYWKARGVRGQLRNVDKVKRIEPRFSLHALRQHIRARLRRLPENSRALMAAVLLGDRDANLSEDFRQWGISHILAVSGWHVGLALFAACFLFGCGRFSIPFCGLFLCGYCLVSGASMSAVRATIIIEIGLLGVFFGRSAVALNSVGVAGVLMLVFNPWAYYDLGWQLSLLAAVVVTSLQKNSLWLASAAAGPMMWIVTSPMIAPIAKGIYFSSLPINIMASGVFTVLLAVVFLGSLPVLFLGTGTVFALPGELLLRFWGAVADQWVEWLPQALPVNYFPLWFCSGTIFFLVARGLKLKLWRCLALAVVGAFIAAIFFFRPD